MNNNLECCNIATLNTIGLSSITRRFFIFISHAVKFSFSSVNSCSDMNKGFSINFKNFFSSCTTTVLTCLVTSSPHFPYPKYVSYGQYHIDYIIWTYPSCQKFLPYSPLTRPFHMLPHTALCRPCQRKV